MTEWNRRGSRIAAKFWGELAKVCLVLAVFALPAFIWASGLVAGQMTVEDRFRLSWQRPTDAELDVLKAAAQLGRLDAVVVLLTVLGIILTGLGIILAVINFFGFTYIKQELKKHASTAIEAQFDKQIDSLFSSYLENNRTSFARYVRGESPDLDRSDLKRTQQKAGRGS